MTNIVPKQCSESIFDKKSLHPHSGEVTIIGGKPTILYSVKPLISSFLAKGLELRGEVEVDVGELLLRKGE